MSRKAIVAAVIAGALMVGLIPGTAGAATPYDSPPSVKPIGKGKVKKGKLRVAIVVCGTGTCSITSKSAVVKVAGFKIRGKFAKSSNRQIPAGQRLTVQLVIPKKLRQVIGFGYKVTVKTQIQAASTNGLTAFGSGNTKIKR
jgi:hypothetical protein